MITLPGTGKAKALFAGTQSVSRVLLGQNEVFKKDSGGIDDNTLLLCPFDTDFADISRHHHVPAVFNPECISINPSGKFDGCVAATIGGVDFTDPNFGWPTNAGTLTPTNVDSTIDFWFYPDGTLGYYDFSVFRLTSLSDNAVLNCYIYHVYNRAPVLKFSGPWGTVDLCTLDYQQWQHIAIVKMDRIIHVFKNGTLQNSFGTASVGATAQDSNVKLTVLGIGSSQFVEARRIDEFRFSKVARWTANFTPPNKPYGA